MRPIRPTASAVRAAFHLIDHGSKKAFDYYSAELGRRSKFKASATA